MNGPLFEVKVITPKEQFFRSVRHLRLSDDSGSFGIMRGHEDFISAFSHCLGYYAAEDGTDTFIALEGGMLSVRGGSVTLSARSVYESTDAESLARAIGESVDESELYERRIARMLEGIERTFIKKTVDMQRERQ